MAANFATTYEYWPEARVRAELSTLKYSDALFSPDAYALHPLNLTRGLARACTEQGCLVFEKHHRCCL